MSQTSSSLQVIYRPALARDHVDIIEFCKGIWDGNDIVPQAWGRWFKDPNGLLVTAEHNGHAIGCAKISLLSDGQWWFEGFRVDPKYQGKKVGFHIYKYLTNWWLENGDGAIRLMTDAENFAVHHLSSKLGYVKTHEVCGYKAVSISEPVENPALVTDISEAAAFAIESESINIADGLTDFGWRFAKPDTQIFNNFSKHESDHIHTFHWWKDKQGLFSIWEDESNELRTLVIGVIACALNDMPALLRDIRRLASYKNFDSVFQIAFDMPQIVSQLEAAGFEKKWKRTNAFIFERNHPGRL